MKLPGDNFYLDGNDGFSDRQKNVFAELDRIGSTQPENRYVQRDDEFRERRLVVSAGRKSTRQFAGQESLFKSEAEPSRRRSAGASLSFVPDFVKHPTKWRKYHLGDDVMSERTNQRAAMSFLAEIRQRKSEDGAGPSMPPPPVKFNRHVKGGESSKSAGPVDAIDKPTFVDGKLTMPEYVVGAEKKKPKAKKSGPIAAGTAVKLGHLDGDDDESVE
ncbi:Hypothetical protein NTJ_14567 [Nesidiocoris tenuis]|uniref:U5 small nuclear ribonucleoprotein TSSC4 n=1 Tax=Nesidiocoris tenuis TaxID=355587 RepID=A0ABN7BBJ7_9HEMI|nr:Hypothetical protein NTJ_14567 [Nesidiocoris tenuis]